MSFGKSILKLFGYFVFGIGLILLLSFLILGALQNNLDNFDEIVDSSVDDFFEENKEDVLAEFGFDCKENPQLCVGLGGEIDNQLVVAKEEIKDQMKEMDFGLSEFDLNPVFYISLILFVLSIVMIYFGSGKNFILMGRGLFFEVGFMFFIVYLFLWKFLQTSVQDLMGMFDVRMDMPDIMFGFIRVLIEKLIYTPLRELLFPFLVVVIVCLLGFVTFLILSLKKKT